MAAIDIKPPVDRYKAIADAIREKNGTTELMHPADMPQAILDIVGGGDVTIGADYTNIVYNEDDTITLTDKDGVEHTMSCTYEGGKLIGVTYDGKAVELTYDGDVLVEVGKTEVDMANVPVLSSGASLNIAYGETAPEDTSKLWIKANEPDKITFKKEVEGAESVSLLDEHLPDTSYFMSCAKVGDKIYLFGGGGNSTYGSATIYVFDTKTETLTSLSTALPKGNNRMGCAVVGKKVYLFGGYNDRQAINVFDTETEAITTLSTTVPEWLYSMGCVAVGTKIYLLGGQGGDGYGSGSRYTIRVFDTETETFATLSATLPGGQESMGCAVVGTKIYLFGGYNSRTPKSLDAIYVFDVETETSSTLSVTLPVTCRWMGCEAIGTKIYLFGGSSDSVINTIYVFDTEAETLAELNTTLITACYGMSCANVGNRIYLFGGNNLNTITKFTITAPLSQGNIELQTSFLNNVFKLINTDNAQVEMGVENVYIGNENNEAELCEAYLHNGIEWAVIE